MANEERNSAGEERYSVGELARLGGVTPRTIRYYTSEGLLPPPRSRGRYASYGAAHLRRLHQIAELKAAYLPLSTIRERLSQLQREQALRDSAILPPDDAPAPPVGVTASMQAADPAPGAEPARVSLSPQLGRVEFFPDDDLGADDEAGPTTRWQRIVLAPGVELAVREPISPQRRAILDALIASARRRLRSES